MHHRGVGGRSATLLNIKDAVDNHAMQHHNTSIGSVDTCQEKKCVIVFKLDMWQIETLTSAHKPTRIAVSNSRKDSTWWAGACYSSIQ